MEKIIREIREFTAADPKLASCHHFLFDLPLNRRSKSELGAEPDPLPEPLTRYVVLGLNPAGDSAGWSACPKAGQAARWHGCEETSLRDGFDLERRRSQQYSKLVYKLLSTWDVVQSELFFWSTDNIREAFTTRFGQPFDGSGYLAWCAQRNWKLLEHYRPCGVIVAGMQGASALAKHYGFASEEAIKGIRDTRIALAGTIVNEEISLKFKCLVVHNLPQARYKREDWAILKDHVSRTFNC
ncbi:MAG: hypothetical protein EOP84_00320 [Verrucomicrobiaceae bacterium]|nr:MAG: hypothetical protein EOP84_00320 [Verrucomicrobiaceae bacterium]